jgi:catalase
MIGHFLRADTEYGTRVAEGLGIDPASVTLPPVEADERPYKS